MIPATLSSLVPPTQTLCHDFHASALAMAGFQKPSALASSQGRTRWQASIVRALGILLLFGALLFSSGCMSMMNHAAAEKSAAIEHEFRKDITCSLGVEVPVENGRELHFPYLLAGESSNRCMVVQVEKLDAHFPSITITEHEHPLPHNGDIALLSFSDEFRDLPDMVFMSMHGEVDIGSVTDRWVHLVMDQQDPEVYLADPNNPFNLREDWISTEAVTYLAWQERPGGAARFGRKAVYLLAVPLDIATFPIQVVGAILNL